MPRLCRCKWKVQSSSSNNKKLNQAGRESNNLSHYWPEFEALTHMYLYVRHWWSNSARLLKTWVFSFLVIKLISDTYYLLTCPLSKQLHEATSTKENSCKNATHQVPFCTIDSYSTSEGIEYSETECNPPGPQGGPPKADGGAPWSVSKDKIRNTPPQKRCPTCPARLNQYMHPTESGQPWNQDTSQETHHHSSDNLSILTWDSSTGSDKAFQHCAYYHLRDGFLAKMGW